VPRTASKSYFEAAITVLERVRKPLTNRQLTGRNRLLPGVRERG
jgi:hypothetical protein